MKRHLAFAVLALGTAVSLVAAAQQPKKPATTTAKPAPTASAKKPPVKGGGKALTPDDDQPAGASAPLATREEKPGPATRDAGAQADKAGGGVVEQKKVDGGTNVYTFGKVDVDIRLKSPQLVYFLRRVRAEFAAGDLGHRSFSRELSETRNEPSF